MKTKLSSDKAEKLSDLSPQLLTVRQFCDSYPWPTSSGMRAMIYKAEELGLSDAFIRIGRRVLVDVNRFFMLIKERGE